MQSTTSRDVGPQPRTEKGRDTPQPIVGDTDKDRDLVHGDGGTLDLPVKPGDMSTDD